MVAAGVSALTRSRSPSAPRARPRSPRPSARAAGAWRSPPPRPPARSRSPTWISTQSPGPTPSPSSSSRPMLIVRRTPATSTSREAVRLVDDLDDLAGNGQAHRWTSQPKACGRYAPKFALQQRGSWNPTLISNPPRRSVPAAHLKGGSSCRGRNGSARVLELDPELGLAVPAAEISRARAAARRAACSSCRRGHWDVPHGDGAHGAARLPGPRGPARARHDARGQDRDRAARRGRRGPALARRSARRASSATACGWHVLDAGPARRSSTTPSAARSRAGRR